MSDADTAARIDKLVKRGLASKDVGFAWVTIVVKARISRTVQAARNGSSRRWSAGSAGTQASADVVGIPGLLSAMGSSTRQQYSDGAVTCVAPPLGVLPDVTAVTADGSDTPASGVRAHVLTDTHAINRIVKQFEFTAPLGCHDVFVDVSLNGGQQYLAGAPARIVAYPVPDIIDIAPTYVARGR